MDITTAIANKLDSAFPDIPIYTENIDFEKADLSKSAFFIQRISMNIAPRLFDMQKRVYRYHIVYFPDREEKREGLDDTAEKLALEIQLINGVSRMTERNFEIIDSNPPFFELHFSFALEVHITTKLEDKFDTQLDYKGGLKDG